MGGKLEPAWLGQYIVSRCVGKGLIVIGVHFDRLPQLHFLPFSWHIPTVPTIIMQGTMNKYIKNMKENFCVSRYSKHAMCLV